MKAFTDEKRRQWLWFAALWCAGTACALALAYLTRWFISIT
jgi:hypothetical protein